MGSLSFKVLIIRPDSFALFVCTLAVAYPAKALLSGQLSCKAVRISLWLALPFANHRSPNQSSTIKLSSLAYGKKSRRTLKVFRLGCAYSQRTAEASILWHG